MQKYNRHYQDESDDGNDDTYSAYPPEEEFSDPEEYVEKENNNEPFFNIEQIEENFNDPLLNKEKFKNRRLMAWISFACIILLTCALFVIPSETVAHYESIFPWVFGTFSSIVLGYMGFTTWHSNVNTRVRNGRG